jgi:hypothetical protein
MIHLISVKIKFDLKEKIKSNKYTLTSGIGVSFAIDLIV